jgi:DNA topoisomerase-3
MSKKIVLLTEKKDVAEKLVAAMGWSSGPGCWTGVFEGHKITVVTARGHLVTPLAPDEAIPGLKWDQPEQLLHIPRSIPLKIIDDQPGSAIQSQPRSILANIKKHLDGADELIIGTDSDREGEAIGWMIRDFLGYTGRTRRAWFAAGLDKKSLCEAMSNLKEPHVTKSYYRAAEARSFSDWGYMFLVRAYTHFASYSCFGENLGRGDGKSRVVSVGRVQSPACGMIVLRDAEIENFVSKDHFKISGVFMPDGGQNTLSANYSPVVTQNIIDSSPLGVDWEPSSAVVEEGEPEPMDSPMYVGKVEVESFKQRLLASASEARISSYKQNTRNENPPKTFSTTDAVVALCKSMKISAGLAQTILEDLYEQGWTSYPRTSKCDLPANLYEPSERNAIFSGMFGIDEISEQAKFIADVHNGKSSMYSPFRPKVFSEKPMEHYGILPTSQVMTKENLLSLRPLKKDGNSVMHTSGHMKDAYLIIAKQFIQAMYPPAKYATQTLSISVPVVDMLGHPESIFKASAEKITDPGWRAAFGANAEKDTSIDIQKEGNRVILKSVELKPLSTKPPLRYTETTFLKAMENIGKTVRNPQLKNLLKNSEGIGTSATRKTIVKTLIDRGYVEVKKDTFYSTPKGRDLIKALPDWLSNAETTALWEDYLLKIIAEKDDEKAIVMRNNFVEKQYVRLESQIQQMIRDLSSKMGSKVSNNDGRVSPKMKDLINLIAKKKQIVLDKDILSNFDAAKAFLDAHVSKDDAPSDSQRELFDKIAAIIPGGVIVPEGCRDSKKLLSEFIDSNMKYLPPTEGQKKFAESLIQQLPEGEAPPDGVLIYGGVCKVFIDTQIKKQSKSGQSDKTKKSSTAKKKTYAKK